MPTKMPTLYEQLGGEQVLRRVVDRFVEQVFADLMIGFFFAAVDKQRVKDKEFEFAAVHLGAPISYTGRPIRAAHTRHTIQGGHFLRRLEILKQTMLEFELPSNVQAHWVAHTESLRSSVTHDAGSECGSGNAVAAGRRRLPLSLATKVGAKRRELPTLDSKKGNK